ncbi:MAG: hypothetical protein ACI924_001386, partial [Flavobacterium sp.]
MAKKSLFLKLQKQILMRYIITLLLLSSLFSYSQEKYLTPFEKGNGNQSTTYEECIAYYQK